MTTEPATEQLTPERLAEVIDGQLEVAGEQVARASGQQAERHRPVDQRTGDRAHRTVAAEGADHARPFGDREFGLTGSRVVFGRLVPRRGRPAVPLARLADHLADLAEVVVLRRVHHDRNPAGGFVAGHGLRVRCLVKGLTDHEAPPEQVQKYQ